MKYFLIIIALSVWQEIENRIGNKHYADEDDVQDAINGLAHDNGVDWDFTCKVKGYSFPDKGHARAFRDGAMAVFDDQEESGECLDLAIIDENGNIIGPEL